MRSVLGSSTSLLLIASVAWAQLPEGPGRQQMEKLCKNCHPVEKSVSVRQDRDGWGATMEKMVSLGVKGSDADLTAIFEYLVRHYPADEVPRINVNKAEAIDLESGLSLPRSQARAVIEYRNKNGNFKSIDDLKKVPGVDAAKIDAKRDRLVFN